MHVTVMADASWCPDTKAGGFGYWVISERGSHGGGGPLKELPSSSIEAEMMACVNAVHFALKLGIAVSGDCLLVQTDCQAAISFFERLPNNTARQYDYPELLKAIRALELIKRKHGIAITFRHVKGHTRRKEPRYRANNLCDLRAKAGMRIARTNARMELNNV